MLFDIEKDTVDFKPNFDDSLKEPTVLRPRFRTFGERGDRNRRRYGHEHSPHNLGEVADAAIYLIDHYDACMTKGVPFDLVWARAMSQAVDETTLAAIFAKLPRPSKPRSALRGHRG